MPNNKRFAILISFIKIFETIALDDAIDILDLLIKDITTKAKKIGQKKRLRSLKDLDKSALILAEICGIIVKKDIKNYNLIGTIYSRVSKEKLIEAILTVNSIARPSDDNFYDEMIKQYRRVSHFLPKLLCNIEFKSAPAGKIILDSLKYLKTIKNKRVKFLKNPPLDIISNSWKRLVFDKKGRIIRQGYIFCFIDRFQDGLRRRDIYVEHSDRWNNPRKKLLQDEDWQSKKLKLCNTLGHSLEAKKAITNLTINLDKTYKHVSINFHRNNMIFLDMTNKKPSINISNLKKMDDSTSLSKLNKQIATFLPTVDLAELILEINIHTRFVDEFTHVSESNARTEKLDVSICAVLLSKACNIGIEPLIKNQIPTLTRSRLNWVKQNYFRS